MTQDRRQEVFVVVSKRQEEGEKRHKTRGVRYTKKKKHKTGDKKKKLMSQDAGDKRDKTKNKRQ